jgi:putative DNA primase/helicase
MENYNNNKWTSDTEIVGEWDYRDESGNYLYTFQRGRNADAKPDDRKPGRFIRWSTLSAGDIITDDDQKEFDQGFKWGQGEAPDVLYRLPELLDGLIDKQAVIHLTEGEKDCDRLRDDFNVVATTNPSGALSWRDEYADHFRDRDLIAFIDNDQSGRNREKAVRRSLLGKVKRLRVVRFTDMPEGSDVSDFLDAGGTYVELMARAIDVTAVQIIKGEMASYVRLAEQRLVDAGVPIYSRAGKLVRPVSDVDESGRTRTHLSELKASAMQLALSEHVDFCRWNAKAKALVREDPSLSLASSILADETGWPFAQIQGLLTTPTLRPDGSVLDRPGFDKATGLYLKDPPAIGPIETTREAAEHALTVLDGLLDEFPFVGADSRSVALSALITPVVRGMMPTAPMHAFTAPEAGSGKSYIGDLAGAILSGTPPAAIAFDSGAEGMKRLDTELLAGTSLIVLDNITEPMNSPSLCQAIERREVTIRILGKSEAATILNNHCIFANGNNLSVSADMVRRTLLCSLDAQMERPEERPFKADPFNAVMTDRGKYIAAALTVVAAYIAAGRPGKLDPMASFAGWSDSVRSALVWLGKADPLASKSAAIVEDTDKITLAAILANWGPAYNGLTAKELIDAIKEDMGTPLSEVLEAVGKNRKGDWDQSALGRYFRKVKNRVVGNRMLTGVVDGKSKVMRWSVRDLSKAANDDRLAA